MYSRKYLYPMIKAMMLLGLVLFSAVETSLSINNDPEGKQILFKPVIDKAIAKGIDSAFIYDLVRDPRTRFNQKFIKINVTGYLKKRDYSNEYNLKSVKRAYRFLEDNYEILEQCTDKYDVPPEVITAVLWVETRHGSYLGNNHIPSVFLSTALADSSFFVQMNIDEMYKKVEQDSVRGRRLEPKIRKRAAKKSKWAMEQLLALGRLHTSGRLDVNLLNGSWAGAFGISQFLPSSYESWAVDGNQDDTVDLFDKYDAIFSVGNYLNINGWGDSKEEKEKAVFHYNNSRDYVNAVLTLATKLKERYTRENSDLDNN